VDPKYDALNLDRRTDLNRAEHRHRGIEFGYRHIERFYVMKSITSKRAFARKKVRAWMTTA
jgi:hypothetical protein